MSTKIILIRHCEAKGNIDRVFNGHYNSDITDEGRQQLEFLAQRMKDTPFDALYSSPLKRALRTAEAANRHQSLEIYIDFGLMEINGGVWEGIPWKEIPVLYPDDFRAWNLEPWRFSPNYGEPMRSVYKRIWTAVTTIAKRHIGETVCIVTHGVVIRNLICRAKRLPIEQLNEVEWCDNTGINIIEFDDGFQVNLLLEGDASHLPDELSTFGKQSWWKKENRNRLLID